MVRFLGDAICTSGWNSDQSPSTFFENSTSNCFYQTHSRNSCRIFWAPAFYGQKNWIFLRTWAEFWSEKQLTTAEVFRNTDWKGRWLHLQYKITFAFTIWILNFIWFSDATIISEKIFLTYNCVATEKSKIKSCRL